MDGLKYKNKELGKRAKEDPRLRHFPFLGWSVVLVPMDVFPSRIVARVFIGTFYGFEPDEVTDLRTRRITMKGENVRTWWVLAIPKAAMDRRARPTGKKARKKNAPASRMEG
jgi:hypothetical protein